MASDTRESGLKRAGVTTHTGRTADGSRRRTLQPAFSLLGVPAVATEPRGSSVLARFARPCGVWGGAPRAPLCQRDLRHLASSILLSGARSSESDEIEFRDRGLQLGSA